MKLGEMLAARFAVVAAALLTGCVSNQPRSVEDQMASLNVYDDNTFALRVIENRQSRILINKDTNRIFAYRLNSEYVNAKDIRRIQGGREKNSVNLIEMANGKSMTVRNERVQLFLCDRQKQCKDSMQSGPHPHYVPVRAISEDVLNSKYVTPYNPGMYLEDWQHAAPADEFLPRYDGMTDIQVLTGSDLIKLQDRIVEREKDRAQAISVAEKSRQAAAKQASNPGQCELAKKFAAQAVEHNRKSGISDPSSERPSFYQEGCGR